MTIKGGSQDFQAKNMLEEYDLSGTKIQSLRQNLKDKLKSRSEFAFAINLPFDINFISFSQRRFYGFRRRYEFDQKRLLIASNLELSVIGYD